MKKLKWGNLNNYSNKEIEKYLNSSKLNSSKLNPSKLNPSKLNPSKLNPNAKMFIPKKLNPNAKIFIPKKVEKNIKKILKKNIANQMNGNIINNNEGSPIGDMYNYFLQKYFTIFQEVCNLRGDEVELIEEALYKRNTIINKNKKTEEEANIEAFKNVRNYKDKVKNKKNNLYYDLVALEEKLVIFIKKKDVNKFISIIEEDDMFQNFMAEYSQCNTKIHPSRDYKGLKKYLYLSLYR